MKSPLRPPPPLNPSGPAICTTLRDAEAVIDSFVAYHLAIGFARIYLFFDDPNDPAYARMSRHPGVVAIRNNINLLHLWEEAHDYGLYSPFVATEVMARQALNLSVATKLARAAGHRWLLHIDSDELFYSPQESAAQHFAALDAQPVDTIVYHNYEAAPEADEIGDFFREVTLFKRPPRLLDEARLDVAKLKKLPGAPAGQRYFHHYYVNGKSAVRLAKTSMVSEGVHSFTNKTESFNAALAHQQFILHYACCGFDAFWAKYSRLGRFSDKWFETYPISDAIGISHTSSRDAVAGGDKQAALDFYRKRFAYEDPKVVETFVKAGVMERITVPRDILAKIPRSAG